MRIIVMSDSHGMSSAVEKIIKANEGADIFVHLGDGEREVNAMRSKYPGLDIRNVDGNCDWGAGISKYIIIEAMDRKIFCAHGHRYDVKNGTESLRSAALENGCCCALFGHTHERYMASENGIDIMNPGSCACPRDGMKPSYGIIDVNGAGLFMNIFDVGQ